MRAQAAREHRRQRRLCGRHGNRGRGSHSVLCRFSGVCEEPRPVGGGRCSARVRRLRVSRQRGLGTAGSPAGTASGVRPGAAGVVSRRVCHLPPRPPGLATPRPTPSARGIFSIFIFANLMGFDGMLFRFSCLYTEKMDFAHIGEFPFSS